MKQNRTIILIPHFNDPDGLLKSIGSISSDEHVDVLIVDDGSEQKKIDPKKINEVFKAHGQLFFEFLPKNKGIEHALNHGLSFASMHQYIYLARLDAGDLNLPLRIYKQEKFLDANPEIDLIGSHANIVDEEGTLMYTIKVPLKDHEIRKRIYITSSIFIHPTIFFRMSLISKSGDYPINYKAVEDYAFYYKVLAVSKAANLDEVLVVKEYNLNSISITKRKKQALNRLRVLINNFAFNPYFFIGLFLNTILYFAPLWLINTIKKILK